MALSFGNSAQGTLAAGATPTFSFLNNNTTSVSMFMLTYYSSGPEFAFSSSLSDPAGNTWHLRKRSILNSNYAGAGSTAGFKFITQEIWWTPNTVSNNRAITVNVVNSANVGMAHWMCRDVLGSLTPTAPWDTNTSFPAVQTFSSASATASITTSGTTSQNNSMIVGVLSEETSTLGSAVAVAGTGYTGVDNRTDGTSPNQFDMFLEDKILATAGATTATCGNNKQAFIFTMDAFSGTSTGTAAGDVGASLARLSSGLNNSGTGTPATVTYTNTDPCVIVLNVVTQGGSSGFTPITGVTDSAGVTWHRRSSKAYVSVFTGVGGGVNHITQEVWWATLTAAHASAVTVSIALSGTANQGTGTLMEWVTVTGSLTPNAPWDVNAALPGQATYSNASVDTVPSAPWTVTSSNAMVLNFLHQMTPSGTINVSNPPTGYVDTGAAQTIGVSAIGVAQAALAWIFGQSGSGTSTWSGGGAGGTGTREWILFADALTSGTTGSSTDTGAGPTTTGTISTSLTRASISAAALEKFLGTVTTTLQKSSQVAAGSVSASGTIATRLTKISQLAQAPGNITGAIVMALRPTSQLASAKEIFTGVAVTNIDANASFAIVARTFESMEGHIVTNLSRASFAAVAEEDFVGQVITRLGSLTGQIVANEIQGLEIIEGPIIMNLTKFNATILGAKLGTPGGGKWYSYRYLDS